MKNKIFLHYSLVFLSSIANFFWFVVYTFSFYFFLDLNIPHPPSFLHLFIISNGVLFSGGFYLPFFWDLWFIPFLLLAFAITDLSFIGFSYNLKIWNLGNF